MKILNINKLALDGIITIQYEKFEDRRGYFSEISRVTQLKEVPGLDKFVFQQANESYSEKGVIRGLHFQWSPLMGKLVRTIRGHMIDVVLDVRKMSPTWGKVILHDMPEDGKGKSGEWIWIPPGFAHGNFFRKETLIEYFCSGIYNPSGETCISPLSSDLDFSMANQFLVNQLNGIRAKAIISEKDRDGISLAEWAKNPNSDKLLYGKI